MTYRPIIFLGLKTSRTIIKAALVTSFFALAACSKAGSDGVESVDKTSATTSEKATLASVIEHPRRGDEAKRDKYRHPQGTLEFFEVGPGKAVTEIWPGWYTNVIAPYLAANGGTYTAVLLPDALGQRYDDRNKAFKEKYGDRSIYGDIQYGEFFSNVDSIAENESQDIVLTFRNVHNWMGRDFGDHAFETFYKALKPGGILGVVEHRLPESATQDPKAKSGYVQESFMKDIASRAGFEFVGSSEINANPKDIADYERGVWTLPPRLRPPKEGDSDEDSYDAQLYIDIGESDRATLKFRKPF